MKQLKRIAILILLGGYSVQAFSQQISLLAERDTLIKQGIEGASLIFEGLPTGTVEYRQTPDAKAVYTIQRFQVIRWLKCPNKSWQTNFVDVAIPGGHGPDVIQHVFHNAHFCRKHTVVFAELAGPEVPKERKYLVLVPWQDLLLCTNTTRERPEGPSKNRKHSKTILATDSIPIYIREFLGNPPEDTSSNKP